MQLSDNMKGAGLMTAAMAGFALNDAVMKAVLADLPLFPSIFIRGIFATLGIGLLAWYTGALRWRPGARDARIMGLRALAEMATTVMFLTALARMPIANATAILQSAPLAVTLAAAVFLGAPVGWRRGLALLIGFAGVLLLVRPGTGSFDGAASFAILAVVSIVIRDLSTRRLSPGVPSLAVALLTAVSITTMGGVVSVFSPFPAVSAGRVGLLGIASVFMVAAYITSVMTMRVGDIAFVSPFRYSILIWALILGLIFFQEVPDALTLAGAVLIVGTGLFTFWREQRLVVRRASPPPLRPSGPVS